jgi:hypothetical protein
MPRRSLYLFSYGQKTHPPLAGLPQLTLDGQMTTWEFEWQRGFATARAARDGRSAGRREAGVIGESQILPPRICRVGQTNCAVVRGSIQKIISILPIFSMYKALNRPLLYMII